jgi:transcriptional regulator with PAS, ATPase and Fis domain
MEIQSVKTRYGIIGNAPALNRALDIAMQVAATNMSVLITGESGVGKESIPKIIHFLSSRKHGPYIAVNCGAIPEGTIDSELFGHEKGSFTGAHESRKGYFEEANEGTIFLDEVAELPLGTQVRLLRVLETGEYIRVGSSKVQKTNVRVVAATNVNFAQAIQNGKFRDDLYYRLNQVPIFMPSLRERGADIELLFKKFATDFAERYRIPVLQLSESAANTLREYRWPGNIRQLKNITEQISILETERSVTPELLIRYLPQDLATNKPMIMGGNSSNDFSEREILYKVLFDMRNDLTDLKKLVLEIIQNGGGFVNSDENAALFQKVFQANDHHENSDLPVRMTPATNIIHLGTGASTDDEEVEESLSLSQTEKDLIKKALQKHRNRRKYAAQELGISERTLYRKIKEYDLGK